jgi:hypothetical protein
LHTYGLQVVAAGVVQVPEALQVDGWVYELPEQLSGAQTVPAG